MCGGTEGLGGSSNDKQEVVWDWELEKYVPINDCDGPVDLDEVNKDCP